MSWIKRILKLLFDKTLKVLLDKVINYVKTLNKTTIVIIVLTVLLTGASASLVYIINNPKIVSTLNEGCFKNSDEGYLTQEDISKGHSEVEPTLGPTAESSGNSTTNESTADVLPEQPVSAVKVDELAEAQVATPLYSKEYARFFDGDMLIGNLIPTTTAVLERVMKDSLSSIEESLNTIEDVPLDTLTTSQQNEISEISAAEARFGVDMTRFECNSLAVWRESLSNETNNRTVTQLSANGYYKLATTAKSKEEFLDCSYRAIRLFDKAASIKCDIPENTTYCLYNIGNLYCKLAYASDTQNKIHLYLMGLAYYLATENSYVTSNPVAKDAIYNGIGQVYHDLYLLYRGGNYPVIDVELTGYLYAMAEDYYNRAISEVNVTAENLQRYKENLNYLHCSK